MPTQTPKTPLNLREFLTTREAFVTSLITLLVDTYGTEFTQWEPETIQIQLEEDFHVNLPQHTLDKIMTGIALLTEDAFYHVLPDFVMHCNIMSGDLYNPELWDPADASEIAWGITEGLLLWPPDEDIDNPFSEEIIAYIGKTLDAEGIMTPPDVLKIASRDTDFAGVVQNDFSDDPDMFGAIHQFESSKTEAINMYVLTNLRELIEQLQALPLKSGNAATAVQQMLQTLTSKPSSGQL